MKILELSGLEYDPVCIQRYIDRLEAKDAYTRGHSHHVFVVTQAIVAQLPIQQRQRINEKMLYAAALLHDIGKTTIPDDILNKEGALNAAKRKGAASKYRFRSAGRLDFVSP